jgi:hypothetical protein
MRLLFLLTFFIFLEFSFAQIKDYKVSYKVYACDDNCKDTSYLNFYNNKLEFNFGIYEGCGEKPNSFLISINTDTLKISQLSIGKRKELKAGSGPRYRDLYCLCYYRVQIFVDSIDYKPSIVDIDHQLVFTEKNGISDWNWYNRNKDKVVEDNSSEISIVKILKQHERYDTNLFKLVFEKLGNDSVMMVKTNDDAFEVSYPTDGIRFSFSSDKKIKEIEIKSTFQGELLGKINWDLKKERLDRKLNSLLKTEILDDVRYDVNGNEINVIYGYICIYKVGDYYLKIFYNKDSYPTKIIYYTE